MEYENGKHDGTFFFLVKLLIAYEFINKKPQYENSYDSALLQKRLGYRPGDFATLRIAEYEFKEMKILEFKIKEGLFSQICHLQLQVVIIHGFV